MQRGIKYSINNCGECSRISSQGSETFNGKGEQIMEGVASCTR
jgi:hypothetical protein